MSKSTRSPHPAGRAALGIAALVAIALLANWLAALTLLGHKGIDFTENHLHTLSPGTRAILAELQAPVKIRYYATRKSEFIPREFRLHMRRVDDLLREYAALTHGRLQIENLDPQPDTDAEDAAKLDGISGQRLTQDDNFFFGLAVTSLERTSVIPFLDPNDETMLEYYIARAIAEVTQPNKPVLALLSSLPLSGRAAAVPGAAPSAAWMIYQQLAQAFTVRELDESVSAIDPAEIKVLLLIHPTDLPEPAQRAIDQFVRGGGTVIACLDPYSVAAQMLGGDNPMMGPPIPAASGLPALLKAWGVSMASDGVIADPKYRVTLPDGRVAVSLLTLTPQAMPQANSILTRGLQQLYLILPGGFTRDGLAPGLTATPLLVTSQGAAVVDATRAAQIDQGLITTLRPAGRAFDLALHLTGRFPAAFPAAFPEAPEMLTTPSAIGNVFLIGDVDFLYDNFAYQVQNFAGKQVAAPSNGNSGLLLNIVDQAVGSQHLIGARSRPSTLRPFTVVQEMEAAFEQEYGRTIDAYKQSEQQVIERLNELRAQRGKSEEIFLSAAQEAEVRELEAKRVDYNRRIREEQKGLRSQKEALSTRMFLLNVVLVPSLVALFGLGIYLRRRSLTRAR
jgi:ABC-type uncharacterized transport system involved in gliding motility auxiliary subunit